MKYIDIQKQQVLGHYDKTCGFYVQWIFWEIKHGKKKTMILYHIFGSGCISVNADVSLGIKHEEVWHLCGSRRHHGERIPHKWNQWDMIGWWDTCGKSVSSTVIHSTFCKMARKLVLGDTCNPYISFAMGALSPNPKAFNPANAVTGPIHSELLP